MSLTGRLFIFKLRLRETEGGELASLIKFGIKGRKRKCEKQSQHHPRNDYATGNWCLKHPKLVKSMKKVNIFILFLY